MSTSLTDSLGRSVSYLRLSVTDRCDLRCLYCMPRRMRFLPKRDLLTFEELHTLCQVFIERGVRKLRLTGGEPLVRHGIMDFMASLTPYVQNGSLHELTMTTNATRLKHFAYQLADCGIKRINISLDTRDPIMFRYLTRGGDLNVVLEGIETARAAGLAVKINTVALRELNEKELPELIAWAHADGMALTLIETMPLGEVDGASRLDHYLPLGEVRQKLAQRWSLQDLSITSGGPARYVSVKETGGRLGFITPLTQNFCASCNRVRVTCTGRLYACLGGEDFVDLREPLRQGVALSPFLEKALREKPERHNFTPETLHQPTLKRHMSVTGG